MYRNRYCEEYSIYDSINCIENVDKLKKNFEIYFGNINIFNLISKKRKKSIAMTLYTIDKNDNEINFKMAF